MLRPAISISEPDLERELLRKGVSRRAVGGAHCADCGRRPLIGESVHRYASEVVCALCRPLRRREPSSTEIVRHVEHGVSVRRREVPRAA